MTSDGWSQMTFAHALWRTCRERPRHPAIITADGELTYEELAGRAAVVAGALGELGVEPGDRVAVVSPNRTEVALLMVAAATIGVAVAPVNWRLSADTAADVVREIAPRAVFVDTAFAHLARAATDAPLVDLDEPRWLGRGTAAAARGGPHAVRGSDLITIMSTSGSTGRPKGVAITQSAMVARALVVSAELGLDAGDAFLGWAPLFHISSTDYLYATLVIGGTFVLLRRFDATAIVDELVRRDVGWLFLVPGLLDELLEALGDRRPRAVKCVGAMADLVPAEQLRRVEERLDAPYLNTFGSTEAGLVPGAAPVVWAAGRPALDKRASLFCQHRVVDGAGLDAGPGQIGELWLRGPSLFAGYWTGTGVSTGDFTDGWFRTGDLVRTGPDGALAFVERRGRMFKCGGENVYPAAIERALLSHPAVEEAAVVPEHHPRFGQAPTAYVALAEQADVRDVLSVASPSLARFERPQAVHVLPAHEFPRGVTGKVQRDRLQASHRRCGSRCVAEPR